MIVDQRMIEIIQGLHKELPVLTTEELLEAKKLVSSPDPDTAAVGQSVLYFSNFFERPKSINYILSLAHELNDDGKSLSMILHAYRYDTITDDINSFKILSEDETDKSE